MPITLPISISQREEVNKMNDLKLEVEALEERIAPDITIANLGAGPFFAANNVGSPTTNFSFVSDSSNVNSASGAGQAQAGVSGAAQVSGGTASGFGGGNVAIANQGSGPFTVLNNVGSPTTNVSVVTDSQNVNSASGAGQAQAGTQGQAAVAAGTSSGAGGNVTIAQGQGASGPFTVLNNVGSPTTNISMVSGSSNVNSASGAFQAQAGTLGQAAFLVQP